MNLTAVNNIVNKIKKKVYKISRYILCVRYLGLSILCALLYRIRGTHVNHTAHIKISSDEWGTQNTLITTCKAKKKKITHQIQRAMGFGNHYLDFRMPKL